MKIFPLYLLLSLFIFSSIHAANRGENSPNQQSNSKKEAQKIIAQEMDVHYVLTLMNKKYAKNETLVGQHLDHYAQTYGKGRKDLYAWPLERAISEGNYALVNILLKHGARDPYGAALETAIKNENYDLAKKLIKQRVSKDPFGYALEIAQEKENHDLIEMLSGKQI